MLRCGGTPRSGGARGRRTPVAGAAEIQERAHRRRVDDDLRDVLVRVREARRRDPRDVLVVGRRACVDLADGRAKGRSDRGGRRRANLDGLEFITRERADAEPAANGFGRVPRTHPQRKLNAARIVATTCDGLSGVPLKVTVMSGLLFNDRTRKSPFSPAYTGGLPVPLMAKKMACSGTSACVLRTCAPTALVVRTSTTCLQTPTTQGVRSRRDHRRGNRLEDLHYFYAGPRKFSRHVQRLLSSHFDRAQFTVIIRRARGRFFHTATRYGNSASPHARGFQGRTVWTRAANYNTRCRD